MLARRLSIRLALLVRATLSAFAIAAVVVLGGPASAHAATAPVPFQQQLDSLIASDNFTRSNQTPIAGNWTSTAPATLNLTSNHVEPASLGADGEAYYSGVPWPNDQYSRAKLSVTGTGGGDQGVGLLVRRSASAVTHYRLVVDHATSDNVGLSRTIAGSYTPLATFTQSWSDGDVWELRITGTKLQIFHNTSQVGTDVIESSITAGSPGLAYSYAESAAEIDDWEGGRAGSSTDPFTRANETPLAGTWTATGLNLSSNHVVPASLGSDGSAYDSRITAWPDNQYSKAKLSVTGTAGGGAGVGLLVRRSASATTHYRLVVDHATSNNVSLKKAIAGSYTTLATVTQSWSDGDVWELRVTNTTLQVFRNGTQVGTDVTDSSIPSGSPGIAYASTESAASIDDWEGGYVPPAGPLWPHQPAGFTAFKNTDFTTFPTDGWSSAGATIVSDLTAPVSPTHQVIQWQFDSTVAGGNSPGAIYNNDFLGSVDEYFVGFHFKFSNPYSNGVNGTGMWQTAGSLASYAVAFTPDSTIFFGVVTPDSVYNLGANITDPKVTPGVWHTFEHYFKPATSPTAHDGILRWWIDGVLCGDYTDLAWPTPDQNWEEWRYWPTWGDDPANHPAFTSYQWVDQIYLSHGPMGPNEPVATPLDPTVPTTLAASTAFLYTGDNPVQTGVDSGTIAVLRAAVLRGQVLTRDSVPLTGVTVTVLDHPEFGQTLTRANGRYDLAVNGGGHLTLKFGMDGYLPAQRQVAVPWQDYLPVPDVMLVGLDTVATQVVLADTIVQIARGSVVSDTDGTRQATTLFLPSTTAHLRLANGDTVSVDSLHVRATEYTVGPNGPAAMPAALPPTSGYTYAVELSADEAIAAGAATVEFSQPVITYVENYLGFPVGLPVPVGSYDRVRGVWVPEPNGRVLRILSTGGGIATIDADGDSTADDSTQRAALGVTDAERRTLAELYAANQTLWRMPLTHFTPIDGNYPVAGPFDDDDGQGDGDGGGGGDGFGGKLGRGRARRAGEHVDKPDCQTGSVIECQNQVLGEQIAVTGTPFTLNYRSDRVTGFRAANVIEVGVIGQDTLFGNTLRVAARIQIAGHDTTASFVPPFHRGQRFTYEWDGRDAYGRPLSGEQTATVLVTRFHQMFYWIPTDQARAFGLSCATTDSAGFSACTLNRDGEDALWRARLSSTVNRVHLGPATAWNAVAQGLGGWSLDVHHAYDPVGRMVFYGNGTRVEARDIRAPRVVAGNGSRTPEGDDGPATATGFASIADVIAAPDGGFYVADQGDHTVRRVRPDGIVEAVAGIGGSPGFSGDGGPADSAELNNPVGLALGPDGSLYIADANNFRVRRVTPSGTIETVAGTDSSGFGGDGGPATAAVLSDPVAVTVAPDGSVYIADKGDTSRVRKVSTDGRIVTVAGGGTNPDVCQADSILAAQTCFGGQLADITWGPEGALYVLQGKVVKRVGPEGMAIRVAGAPDSSCSLVPGDGGSARDAGLCATSVAVAPTGEVFLADNNERLRVIEHDGTIRRIGSGRCAYDGPVIITRRDPPPILLASTAWVLPSSMMVESGAGCLNAVALAPDGSLLVTDPDSGFVNRLQPALPGVSLTNLVVAAPDGGELYVFSAEGRHLETRNALTGATTLAFAYDTVGRLVTITDADSNVTTIERNGSGEATAIVAPFGQQTTLAVDSNAYLASVTNPAGEVMHLTHDDKGLLERIVNPLGDTTSFTYDSLGLLLREDDPAGGSRTLARDSLTTSTTLTTAEGRVTRYDVGQSGTEQRRRTVLPTGLTVTTAIAPNAGKGLVMTTTRTPDGMITTVTTRRDPRFPAAEVLDSMEVVTPGELNSQTRAWRTVDLADPDDPLSLVSQTDSVRTNGHTTVSTYTASTRRKVTTTPEGRQFVTRLDSLGRVVSTRAADLDSVTFSYDSVGRLAEQRQGGRVVTYGYSPASGRLTSVTDPLGRVTQFGYDSAGRVIRQTRPDSTAILFAYDSAGRLTSLTPPGDSAHGFQYTPVGLVKQYDPPGIPGSKPTKYFHNRDRQLDSLVRADSITVALAYDSAGRPSAVSFDRGTLTIGYSDTSGNLTRIRTPEGDSLVFSYDGSLPTQVRWSGLVDGTVGVAYDNNFRVTKQAVNGDTVAFGYDADGLLASAGALVLGRSATNGLLLADTLGRVRSAYQYSSRGEFNSYRVLRDTSKLFATGYVRDSLGRIVQLFDTTQGTPTRWSFVYDSVGRLVKDSVNGAVFHAFTYDANGNRLSFTSGSGTVTYSYDAQDRLLKAVHGSDTTTYSYGSNGELKTKAIPGVGTTTYTYDALGNLLTVVLPDSTVIGYVIDGQNRRVGRKVNGVLMQGWLYQNQLKPVAELDSSGSIVSRFVYGSRTNVPDYMIKGGNVYRLVVDHLGSVRLVVDTATGAVAQRIDYEEWGNIVQDTNPAFQPFGFAGGLYDENVGLVRFGARDYDPAIGRWTNKDPIGFRGGDPNVYGYLGGDPANHMDVLGLCEEEDVGERAERECSAVVGEFFGTVALDLSFLFGVGEALTLERSAGLAVREGASLGERGLYEVGGRSARRAARDRLVERDIVTNNLFKEDFGTIGLAKALGETSPFSYIPFLDLGPAGINVFRACDPK